LAVRSKRKPTRPTLLDYSFEKEGAVLEVRAPIARGWRFLKKVYGFSEQVTTSSLAHSDLRVQVQLFPRFGAVVEEAPVFADTSGPWKSKLGAYRILGDGSWEPIEPPEPPIRFAVTSNQCVIRIDVLGSDRRFNPNLGWRLSVNGAPTVKWLVDITGYVPNEASDAEPRLVEVQHDPSYRLIGYQLQVLLVARPPALRAGPVERAWLERHFVVGGLPSLGKRQ
jgi:hypothetical protein